ncbi:DUF2878 domain-containing protein [Vibrio furnissii]|uniref:DUF2878 domain-containing protein n=1 Tax=Vibrio TaxID=662 RepID=UPI0024B93A88|nr:DUF2878 domain-containing protein [Vibrio furnissii]WHR52277.1 DUF2878 domain-containing protein [Vibrio furnissii]
MMRRFLLISLWFEFIWLLAVLGQERLEWVTVGVVTATLALTALRRPVALERVILVAACGIALDYANLHVGLFSFTYLHLPIWLMGLWFAFAWFASFAVPAVNHLPRWFVLICTALGGALSYWAGYRFGAVQFELSVFWSVLALFLEWFLLSLLLMKVFRNENITRNRSTLPDGRPLGRDRE